MKLYTTICSSAPSELLVALALRHGERLIARNRAADARQPAARSMSLLARRGELFEWVRPTPARSASRASAAIADVAAVV